MIVLAGSSIAAKHAYLAVLLCFIFTGAQCATVPRGMPYRCSAAQHTRCNATYGTMGQTAHDRLVIRGLLCSAWRAVTIPIYARGAQVADNRALISGCVGNYCQL